MSKINDLRNHVLTTLETDTLLRELALDKGLDLAISFPRPGKRDIREDADIGYFRPDEGHGIRIDFVRRSTVSTAASTGTEHPVEIAVSASGSAPAAVPPSDVTQQRVIRILDRAEHDPHRHFVGLKWFRDVGLRNAGLDSTEARQQLQLAINAGYIDVVKLSNPNSPFPTSALRLRRDDPEVRRILEEQEPPRASRLGFAPLDLPGVHLSEIVIEGRR